MTPPPMDDQVENDGDDEDDEAVSESQAVQNVRPAHGMSKPQSQASSSPNNQFELNLNPSLANLNLPPIIMQTLEMAAAAPSPPIPLLSSSNPLNFDPMPMPMAMKMPQPNESNVNEEAHNKPAIDPVDEESEQPIEPTETPNFMMNTQSSVPNVESSTANSMTKPTDAVKQYQPALLFGSPLYQSSYYNQYNTFIPYFLYPFRRNIPFHTRKHLAKSKRVRSPQKSSAVKNIIINIS